MIAIRSMRSAIRAACVPVIALLSDQISAEQNDRVVRRDPCDRPASAMKRVSAITMRMSVNSCDAAAHAA